jgi:3-oxoacyl-[acyl-carrier protein] reductase
MDLGIRGRVALVTGASSGLGEAVALGLAEEGATLALAARRHDRLAGVAAEAKRRGAADARAFAMDLHDSTSVQRTLREIEEAFGTPDILVANGGGPKPGTYVQLSLDDWEAGYRGTLRPMIELVNAVLPGMTARGWGRIVALTSSSVKQPIQNLALSNAYRIALVAALKSLSGDVAKQGITVNAIATGRVRTDRLTALYPDAESMNRAAEQEIPIGRVAEPSEFAPLVVFLCSEPARYVTGQTIAIDGGLIRYVFG